MISENEVAVLIPAYDRPQMTVASIRDALATGAGEVVVSEDLGDEELAPHLRRFGDPRLRVVRQPKRLGLWRNHLALLKASDKKWIKFLQTDDRLNADCLHLMCSAVGQETTLVGVLPIYHDLDSGVTERRYELSKTLRWPGGSYVDRMARVGNEPGRPSYTLFRREALLETDAAWCNDCSCDLVANVLAAARGEVVLLPPGPVTCGIHRGRDGSTQSFQLLVRRLVNALAFLSTHSDRRVRRFVTVYGTVETLSLIRLFFGKLRRGHQPLYRGLASDLLGAARAIRPVEALRRPRSVRRYMAYKYQTERPIRIQKYVRSFPSATS